MVFSKDRAVLPKLKLLMTFDGRDIEDFCPEIPHNFHVLLHLTIGPSNQDGGDDFSLAVCTPTWIEHHVSSEGRAEWGRHLLIVNRFDGRQLKATIERKITSCGRSDWPATAEVLSRHFAWEFEDYSPHVGAA
jgi:Immunity protein 8